MTHPGQVCMQMHHQAAHEHPSAGIDDAGQLDAPTW